MDLLVYHLNNFIELYMLYKVLNSKWIEYKSWWINIPIIMVYVWTAVISISSDSNQHISGETK